MYANSGEHLPFVYLKWSDFEARSSYQSKGLILASNLIQNFQQIGPPLPNHLPPLS